MAQTVLMVYEKLETLKENRDYWQKYIKFYEKFWDGPATPNSSWWGRDFDEFRQSLSNELNLDESLINDCFFIKNEENNYFICPVGMQTNLNIITCENYVPLEWFSIFDEDEKHYFYTHTGFGAIHHDAIYYRTTIDSSLKKMDNFQEMLFESFNKKENDLKNYPELQKLKFLIEGIDNLKNWVINFDNSGLIILNYGEICSYIEQNTLKNENSVGELLDILNSFRYGDFNKAESDLRILDYKWTDIAAKAIGETDFRTLQ